MWPQLSMVGYLKKPEMSEMEEEVHEIVEDFATF